MRQMISLFTLILYFVLPAVSFAQFFDAKIAFSSDRDGNDEIYVMDADGSNPLNLTNNPAFDGAPSWSPDGTQIVFVSTRDGNPEIYVMDADGSNPLNLTNSPANDCCPSWLAPPVVAVSTRGQVATIWGELKGEWHWYHQVRKQVRLGIAPR